MTVRVCVVGHPAAYSRSPLLHGYWIARHGIDGSYGREDVPPEVAPGFFAALATRYDGCNVTAPNKEIAFRAVDVADATAQRLEAVNTIWFETGRMVGGNTDSYGFMANLDSGAPGWAADRPVLVLGAGGAARAIVHGLLERGVPRLDLANRTLSRAAALADLFGPRVRPVAWDAIAAPLREAGLVVNTTSLGMKGHDPLEIDLDAARPDAVVTDAVYVPLETPFLKAAKARGLATVDGLGMLLHQAVPGFARWFGVQPEVDAGLRALIVADLRAKGQLEA
ncbi:shikimate dehydrogenase [Aquabacter spiritensis]|uniref:Shikimate dehydrogenase (NADP(+)) n=1 Tax=Aquabacter spiritensis TaxID=933073 RepID=A0A4V2UY44_9HYPH|nr:shikimate dehydrogenase [Aquabacter spiritensis]TCT05958.1 shikimate dehydrogenase [Aquabacter spiritensis]